MNDASLSTLSRRIKKTIIDELDRKKTLISGQTLIGDLFGTPSNEIPPGSNPLLLLGIGPFPEDWQLLLKKQDTHRATFWIEAPEFERQMPIEWYNSIPKYWEKISVSTILTSKIPFQIYRYLPACKLFSSFWGSIIGSLQKKSLGIPEYPSSTSIIVLPGTEHDLLTYELIEGCKQHGFIPLQVNAQDTFSAMTKLLKDEQPSLFLSINLRGLDREGNTFRLLQASNVSVAIWFVDNPWHILSTLRSPWWKEATLFTTDPSFIPSLHNQGAQYVYYLPLAAWTKKICTSPKTKKLQPIVFIGRSNFPNKKIFFSGIKLPEHLIKKVHNNIKNNTFPDIHWWIDNLNIKQYWPEKTIRIAGLGAENTSLLKRQTWLNVATQLGLTIFGNPEWHDWLPECMDLRSPIDYYSTVPNILNRAKYNLNITSLLIPGALTQRHFDTWAFDGFLITDKTAGLSLFPSELIDYISINSAYDIPSHIERLEKDTSLRTTLMHAWKKYIMTFHTYSVRLENILSTMHIE